MNLNNYFTINEQKQLKIDLRISKVIEQVTDKKIIDLLVPETIDQCYIEYRLPSIREIIIFEKEKDIYSFYTFFLKTIKFSNSTIDLEDYTFKEREEIIQKIPVKVMTGLTKRTHTIVEHCNKINLLQSLIIFLISESFTCGIFSGTSPISTSYIFKYSAPFSLSPENIFAITLFSMAVTS